MTCLSFCDVKHFVVSGGDVILLALFLDFFLAEGIPTDVNATPLLHNVIVITRVQVESLKSKPSKPFGLAQGHGGTTSSRKIDIEGAERKYVYFKYVSL